MYPVIDKQKCTGCDICIEFCPVDAVIRKNDRAYITIACIECGACIAECPEEAIAIEDE